MNNRHEQFLNLYQFYRHKDQASFYEARAREFEAARRQATILASLLMGLTAIVSVLLSNDIFGINKLWATLVVVFPALSTAISSYATLFGFEKQAKLYKEALRKLRRAEADLYDAQQLVDDAERQVKIEAYVSQVEDIFRKEQGQWREEPSEGKAAGPPAAERPDK